MVPMERSMVATSASLAARQPVDDLRSPALLPLACQDIPTDLPVEQHEFVIDG